MNQAIEILSRRAENSLLKIAVSAVAPSDAGRATKKAGLNATETAGTLAYMQRGAFLALMIYTDLLTQSKDIEEMEAALKKHIEKQPWCDTDLKNIDQRISGLAVNAIFYLHNKCTPLATNKQAKNLGISTTAFNNKWVHHQQEVYKTVYQWLALGASRLHGNSGF